MRFTRSILLALLPLAPQPALAQQSAAAERAWQPFFASFRRAVKERDRAALRAMLSEDFFSSGGNSSGPEAAFELWDDARMGGWAALEEVLAKGAVRKAAWWNPGGGKYFGRVAPPAANIRRNVRRGAVDWYTIFEFRGGRWYYTVFNRCCE